jgi:hypothetical protein
MESGSGDLWVGAYTLDERGNPIPERDMVRWAVWFASAERRIALTEFAWGAVSTVFLGLDHSFNLDPMRSPLDYHPVLWETMVFGGPLDQHQWRYTSRQDALAGHRRAVEQCKQSQRDSQDQIAVEIDIKTPATAP